MLKADSGRSGPACRAGQERSDKPEGLLYPILAVAIVALATSSWQIRLAEARVTAARAAIGAVFWYWLATNRCRVITAALRVRQWLIPAAIVINASIVSWTAATDLTAAMCETVRLCLVLVCLVVPFADSIRTTASARLVVCGSLAALGVAAAIALSTYERLPIMRISGFDGHPNTLGARMSLAIPALAILSTASANSLRRIAELSLLSLLSAALSLTFSRAGMMAAALAAMLAIIMLPIKNGIRSSSDLCRLQRTTAV